MGTASEAPCSAGTLRPLTTEALAIPPLSLAGRLPEQHNAVINLDLAAATPAPGGGAAADFTAWPEFHNGVAAGETLLQSRIASCVLAAQGSADVTWPHSCSVFLHSAYKSQAEVLCNPGDHSKGKRA